MIPRTFATVVLVGCAGFAAGCGDVLDTSYGGRRTPSVNGTGVLAELFRDQGHEVRTAIRLTDELEQWADVIVRFAPYPGPPERKEAQWYLDWLNRDGGRRMIYVPRDYDAGAEYWTDVLDRLPKGGDPKLRNRAQKMLNLVPKGSSILGPHPKEVASPDEWFAVETGKAPPTVCKTLGGPWGEDVDPAEAAVTRRDPLKVDAETVLLTGDGDTLAMEWTRPNGSEVLVVANGSFLLNATLLNPARRPLAWRVARWAGEGGRRVAFVEGQYFLFGMPTQPSIFTLLGIPPFGWIAAQLLVLGLAACLARARLGRPRPEPPSDEDRPVAHPEALGALLARTGQAADARAILESYRRWRNPAHHPRAGPSGVSSDRPESSPQPESSEHE